MAPTAAHYTGNGDDFYEGIPARDLTADDLALLSDEQRDLVASGHLYAQVASQPPSTNFESVTAAPSPPMWMPPTIQSSANGGQTIVGDQVDATTPDQQALADATNSQPEAEHEQAPADQQSPDDAGAERGAL